MRTVIGEIHITDNILDIRLEIKSAIPGVEYVIEGERMRSDQPPVVALTGGYTSPQPYLLI